MNPHLKVLRPHQWVKNIIFFIPVFFTPEQFNFDNLFLLLIGFTAFCLISSSIYILNDTLDRKSDQLHPVKKNRPIASGEISLPKAIILMLATLIAAVTFYPVLPNSFYQLAVIYFTLNIFYSFKLKKVPILELLIVCSGFIIRLYCGCFIINISPSNWLLLIVGLLSLFLVTAKRRDDLAQELCTSHRKSLHGYNLKFLDQIINLSLAALFISYLIFTLESPTIIKTHSVYILATALLVLSGIMRYLQLIYVFNSASDPTKVILKDIPLQLIVIAWITSYSYLLYS